MQRTSGKKVKVRMVGKGDGLLVGLPPESFETWVGERFRDLGYNVQVTPYQGDHGVDLVLTRGEEHVIVQCKHHPFSTVGEPVLRDLYGTLRHVGATSAALVTTGQISKAAHDWLVGKPIQVWDAPRLKTEWGAEIARVTEELSQRVSPTGASGTPTDRRTGWYVYTDAKAHRWAVELPRSIGDQVALGFEPLTDPTIPALPRTLRMRHVNLKSREQNPRYLKRVPHGQPRLLLSAHTEGLVFTSSGGRQTVWRITGEYGEMLDRGLQPAQPNGFRPPRWVPNGPGVPD
jgi:hypothetical protein